MKHKRLLIISTCLVFVMVCVLCFKELFTVKDINVEYLVTSSGVNEEVYGLVEEYKGRSIFSIDVDEIKNKITSNHYLKVISIKKNYPNEILISLIERSEKYYYVANDAVYYFDDEFFTVRRSDDAPVGETYLTELAFNEISTGAQIPVECSLMSYFNFPEEFLADREVVIDKIQGVSSSVIKISFVTTGKLKEHRIELHMREGVVIEIYQAGISLEEKLQKGIDYYKQLEEGKKIEGFIYVLIDDRSGKVVSNYRSPE